MKFRKLPVEIEATQWFKDGDHQAVRPCDLQIGYLEGIGPYGWLPTLEGGHIVTPGDWIITGVKGEMYPCKPDIFALTYEPAGRAQRHDGDKQLSRKHDFVRSTLAHHGINNVHTALVADLIHGLDDLRQVGQEPVAILEHTVAGILSYYPISAAAYKLPMGVEFRLYAAAQPGPVTVPAGQKSNDVEIAALRKDAERYREFRKSRALVIKCGNITLFTGSNPDYERKYPEALDAAIDDAIAQAVTP